MSIVYHEKSKEYHLFNDKISYLMKVLPNGQLGQVYFGKKVKDREDFSHLIELDFKPMVPSIHEDRFVSMELLKQEYPSFGGTDNRTPAFELEFEDGSHVSELKVVGHEIFDGKKKLEGLPATYVENAGEAATLEITMKDEMSGLLVILSYSIFEHYSAIARSVRFVNGGEKEISLERAMSFSVDLPDSQYDWMQFSGAWSRERKPIVRPLTAGSVSIESTRGCSSADQNPFIMLKRKNTDEFQGNAFGFSLIYSGNFLAQAEVNAYEVTRVMMGIHPRRFSWKLKVNESFQAPEAVMVFSENGLNGVSQTFHELYRSRLSRGTWRDKTRPILINNWEATGMDFNEEKVLHIAKKAKECGIELFVLDDGWFGARNDDFAGLGDWVVNKDKLPDGITGLAKKIKELGMLFGLWFEPEMVNEDSDLYRAHPDWVLSVPGRERSLGRNQMVLDFSKPEVVEFIYEAMHKVLSEAEITYVKWDMNRSITECYSVGGNPNQQGEIYHRYILGVYSLYERLIRDFPHILFESCASGGSRFDAGMLYYAPQCWTSDDTDAAERLKIQYGTSYGYPIVSMGAHVSEVPNQQVHRSTPLATRANVACFGTFGYELDLNELPEDEIEMVKKQVVFMKEYRELIQYGTFYRLRSPFENDTAAWMVVSPDKENAIVGFYKLMNQVNQGFKRLNLKGLEDDFAYEDVDTNAMYYGDELMNAGLIVTDPKPDTAVTDYWSKLVILKKKHN